MKGSTLLVALVIFGAQFPLSAAPLIGPFCVAERALLSVESELETLFQHEFNAALNRIGVVTRHGCGAEISWVAQAEERYNTSPETYDVKFVAYLELGKDRTLWYVLVKRRLYFPANRDGEKVRSPNGRRFSAVSATVDSTDSVVDSSAITITSPRPGGVINPSSIRGRVSFSSGIPLWVAVFADSISK